MKILVVAVHESLVGTTCIRNCLLSRQILEGKRTCHGDRESDVHGPVAGISQVEIPHLSDP